jgi:hypothetical protein
MKCLFVVMRRELAANRNILLASAAIGLLPLVIPLFPGLDRWPYPLVRTMAARACAVVLAFILSIALGWSVIGRDLAERRLGFYFARPIPSWAIWAGKFLAVSLVVTAAACLALLPATILGGDPIGDTVRSTLWWPPAKLGAASGLFVIAAICLFLMILSHMLGVVLRTRSLWTAVHFPLLFGALLYGTVSARRLTADFAPDALAYGLTGLAVVLLLAPWVASGAQVAIGRTEQVRGHHVLAMVLWPILFAGLLGFDLFSRWVVNVTGADLEKVEFVGETNDGTWIPVLGKARNRGAYYPFLLFDTATGQSLKTTADRYSTMQEMPVISRNGNRAAWISGTFGDGPKTLFTADLDASRVKSVRVSIPITGFTELALSPDGTRIALLQPNLVTIYELPSGRFVGGTSLRCPDQIAGEVRFTAQDRVRIHVLSARKAQPNRTFDLKTMEFDAAARALKPITTIGAVTRSWLPADPASGKLVVWKRGPQGGGYLALCDILSGPGEKALLPEGTKGIESVDFIADGSIVVMRKQIPEKPQLLLFTPEGELVRAIDLPGISARLGGEYAPGQMMVAISGKSQFTLNRIDLASGKLLQSLPESAFPIYSQPCLYRLICSSGALKPGDTRSSIYISDRALISWDPVHGTKRTLIGTAEHRKNKSRF